MQQHMSRQPEPEYMDEVAEAEAYALSDFSEVNRVFVERLLELVHPPSRLHRDYGGRVRVRGCV